MTMKTQTEDGWNVEGDGKEVQKRGEGTYVYLWVIYVNGWQRPTQFCKAIVFQLKNKQKNKNK